MNTTYSNLDRFIEWPTDYTPSEFFSENVTSFVPPIYHETAQKLESRYRIPFVKAWAWESANLLKECGLVEALGECGEFFGGLTGPKMRGFSAHLSEVYRSAFVRTIAWFHSAGRVTNQEFVKYSMMACPIDLSLWEINTKSPPPWWPHLIATPGDAQQGNKTVGIPSWLPFRDLVNIRTTIRRGCSGQLLAVEGTSLWTDDSRPEGIDVRFSLHAFAYKILGPILPTPESVGRYLLHRGRWIVYPDGKSLHCIMDTDSANAFFASDDTWTIDDLEVYPLVFRIKPLIINTWQWFRGYDLPIGLSTHFARMNFKHGHNSDSWYFTLNRRKIAVGSDWRIGPLERVERDAFPLHGQFLTIESGLLDKFLDDRHLRLAYHLNVEIMSTKYRYDEPKEHTYHEFINLGRVIIEDD